MPTKIILFGIDLTAANQDIFLWFVFAVTALLFIEFLCFMIPDGVKWWGNFWSYRKYFQQMADYKGSLITIADPYISKAAKLNLRIE